VTGRTRRYLAHWAMSLEARPPALVGQSAEGTDLVSEVVGLRHIRMRTQIRNDCNIPGIE